MRSATHPLKPLDSIHHILRRRLVLGLGFAVMAGCTRDERPPKPPITIPFDTQTAGFRIDTKIRLVEFNVYEIGFKLGFKANDDVDRSRVLKLAGDPRRDAAGKLIAPGVAVPLRISISPVQPSDLEHTLERFTTEHRQTAVSDTEVYTTIAKLRLKRGDYRIVVENLRVVPELAGTPVTLYVVTDPKLGSIPE